MTESTRALFRNSIVLSAICAVGLVGCRTVSSTPAPRVILEEEISQPTAMQPSVTTTQPLAEQVPMTAPAAPLTTAPASQPVALADRLESILTRLSHTGARLSARVVDPETGEQLFAYDAGRPMVPASNMKLMVTSAALDFLGPDAVLETHLIIVGQDLWLVGTGDPGPGDESIAKKHGRSQVSLFDDWAGELAARGITSLAGNLYYVDNAFDRDEQIHPTWGKGDLTEWYAAPVGGLNLNDNCVDTIVSPATQPGERPTVRAIPPTTSSIVIVNDAATGPSESADDRPAVSRAADQNLYTITGRVNAVTQLRSKPVTDPGAFFADALRTHLASRGITIAGATVRADAPPTSADLAPLTPATTAFADILARINKNSQNMFAEATAKYLGRAFAQQADRNSKAVGNWSNADKAIRAFLAKNEIADGEFIFADGSGLSRENRVSARLLSDVLLTMHRHAYFEAFKQSLTIAGVDGTTRSRFKDKPGRVFCKTGYIGGVRSLSGYVETDSGKLLVFSFLYNNIPQRGIEATRPYEALQDEALELLMQYPTVR